MSSKPTIPFPNLPLPSKHRRINNPPFKPIHHTVPATVPAMPTPTVNKSVAKPAVAKHMEPIAQIFVPELVQDDKLAPEPPNIQDKGSHIVQELDAQDYT